MNYLVRYRALCIGIFITTLAACGGSSGGGGGGGGGTPPVCVDGSGTSVFWTANRETAVNTTGGGYNVYYSLSDGFNIGDGGVMSQAVPYAMGATAPVCTELTLASGTWFIRVTAFSALNGGSESAASPQTSVVVP